MSNNLEDAVLAFGITGVVLTAVLLLSIAYAAWNPVSRPHLNRVSFRLLVCALISNLNFGASFIPVFSGPSAGCSFLAFFGVLNNTEARTHRLVIVHRVNGNMMEKYYYIGSVVFVAISNITPYAAGQYGYYNGACWFNNPDPEAQFRWLVGSQSVWALLMSTGEVVSFFVILGYMLLSLPPPLLLSEFHRLFPGHLAGQNPSLHQTRMPHFPIQQWRLSLDLCVYGLRPILYTLLAAGDMSFLCAIRAIRTHGKTTHSTTDPASISTVQYATTGSHPMRRFSMNSRAVVHVQLEQGKQSTTWGTGGGGLFAEQSSGGRSFEELGAMSQSDAGAAKGKPALVEQEREEEELDVEAQTRSRAEDIVRQM
ncbi:hypothetical protein C8J57DRAFT_1594476 [Mycena rebaudengoi]|nr:hypothetical protein C8J57DRAFT_1594476 [Mycena rebaudengoi]